MEIFAMVFAVGGQELLRSGSTLTPTAPLRLSDKELL